MVIREPPTFEKVMKYHRKRNAGQKKIIQMNIGKLLSKLRKEL